MAISYGVGVCIEGQVKPKQLESIVKDALASLAKTGATFSVYRSKKHTLLIQGDGDHERYLSDPRFVALSQRLALELKTRTWFISGFAGTANDLTILGFDSSGKQAWKARQRKAFRQFMDEAGFEDEPFTVNIKPFLAPTDELWKRVTQIDVRTPPPKQEPIGTMELARLLGIHVGGVKAWKSMVTVGDGIEVTQVVIPHGVPKVPEQIELREGGLWFPSFSKQRHDMTVPMPDGTYERGVMNSFRGLSQEREGKKVTLRWATKTHANAFVAWVAVGPFVEDFEVLAAEERQAHATEEALAAIRRDNPKRLLAAIDDGADAETYAAAAGSSRSWKCFEAALTRVPKKRVQSIRNELLNGSWKEAVKHGADIDAPVNAWNVETLLHLSEDVSEVKALLDAGASPATVDVEGRTPLHRAQNAEIAMVLIDAGAPLDVRDREKRTPLSSYLHGMSFSAPTEEDIEVVLAMLKRGSTPKGTALAQRLSAWKSKPSHAKAYTRITSA